MEPQTDPLEWARDHTPILSSFQTDHAEIKPFNGQTVAVASHLEKKTGVFIETLHTAGADVLFTPSEPKSTHGDVVKHLDQQEGITAFAREGMTTEEFEAAHHELLECKPDIILDDGCELIAKAHTDHPRIAAAVTGGAEQTTAGIHRLEAMDRDGVLQFPVYGVNDTPMKHFFDNVHGTGESALTNIAITTNTLISGKNIVVAGYGYVGRGVARKARAIGANTIVTEVDPRKALQAFMDGHRVMSMSEAAEIGDVFITTTGNTEVIRQEHMEAMPDNVLLGNAGHFDVEIDLKALNELAIKTTTPKEGVTRYHLPDGRRLNLLANGRLVNLTGPHSQGHPAEVMDTTFSMMYMAALDHVTGAGGSKLEPGLYAVPDRLDRDVADRKLAALGNAIDTLTNRQREYRASWTDADSY